MATPGEANQDAGPEPFDLLLIPTGLYFMAAMTLGGSSSILASAAGLEIGGLLLLALALACLAVHPPGRGAIWPLVLAALALAVPLVQLVPLPPEVWRHLPGREIVAEGYQVVGAPQPWLPVSLDPAATWGAFFKLAPPLSLFCATLVLGDGARRRLAIVVPVAAVCSIALAILQKSGGEGRAFFGIVDLAGGTGASGLFANRNHQGLLLATAIPLSGLIAIGPRAAAWGRPMRLVIGASLILVLAVGAIVTTSRAALALVGLSVLFTGAIAGGQLLEGRRSVWGGLLALLLIFALLLGAGLAATLSYAPTAERFQTALGSDLRFSLFPKVAKVGLELAPVGGGMGAFAAVYQGHESATEIAPAYINHAHNDYLELWLEAGFAALAMIVGFLLWYGRAALAWIQTTSTLSRPAALTGAGVIALILLHSLVDYPLRTPAIAALFGFSCALLVPPPHPTPRNLGRARKLLRVAVASLVAWPILGVCGWLCFSQSVAAYYDVSDPDRALVWWSRNPQALIAVAEREFGQSSSNPASRTRAGAMAMRALHVSPLNPVPLRVLGLIAEGEGRPARAIFEAAAHRSLRDKLTQVWLFSDALSRRDYPAVMMRGDIALRQAWQIESILVPLMIDTLGAPEARRALASALAQGPDWRSSFLNVATKTPGQLSNSRGVYARLRASARPPTAAESAGLINRLVEAGRFAEAHWEWAQSAKPPAYAAPAFIYDGDFRGLPGEPPFNWKLTAESGAYAELVQLDDGASALSAVAVQPGPVVLARQLLVLAPGHYQLTGSARVRSGDFSWRMTCFPAGPPDADSSAGSGSAGDWRPFALAIEVPQGCAAQYLELVGSAPDGVEHGEASFRHLELQRIVGSATVPVAP